MKPGELLDRAKPFLLMGAGLLAGMAWPLLHQRPLWLPGLVVGLLGLGEWLFPDKLAPLWRALEKTGKAVAHYNGMLLLSLLYFLVITPAGAFARWRSRPGTDACAPASFYEEPGSRAADHMRRMF